MKNTNDWPSNSRDAIIKLIEIQPREKKEIEKDMKGERERECEQRKDLHCCEN